MKQSISLKERFGCQPAAETKTGTTVSHRVALAALKQHRKWAAKLDWIGPTDRADQNRAANAVMGCLRIIAASPTTDLRGWLGRKPRREKLRAPADVWRTDAGRRAMRELVVLTVSELEASRAFRPMAEVGPLPVGGPRKYGS